MKTIIGNEFRTGIFLDPAKGTTREWDKSTAVTQPDGIYNLKTGLCNGLRVVGDFDGFDAARLEQILAAGADFVMVDTFRCQKETIAMLFEKMREHPGKIWLTPFGELDGSFWKWIGSCPDGFASRSDAAAYFKHWLCRAAETWADPNRHGKWHHVRDCASPLLPLGDIARHIETGSMPEWTRMAAHSSALYALHHYYEWGFKMVWLEQSAWFGNLQLSLGFLRGAAAQHDGLCGIDFSSWGGWFAGGDSHLPVCYGEDGRRMGGANPDHLFKGWLLGYLAGMDFIFQEVTEHAYFLPVRKGEKPKLSECGKMAAAFADFALRRHPDRPAPFVPLAVMLEHDHGWDAPRYGTPYFVWGNKVPYENGDRMIENFFDLAFPGYKLAPRSYEPDANPDVPWRNHEEYMNALRSGADMRPYDKGKLTRTRWCDGIDVLLEDAPVNVLKKYPVIAVMGRLKIDSALEARLKEYVKAGGTLVLTSANIGSAHALAGVMETGGGMAVGDVFWDTEQFFEPSYPYVRYNALEAEPLARNGKGDAVSYRRRLGAGQILLSAAPFGQSEACQLLGSFVRLLDMAVRPQIPVRLDDAGTIEIAINRGDGRLWVSLFNHAGEPWSGKITVGAKSPRAMDIWNDVPVEGSNSTDGTAEFKLEIERYGFRILAISLLNPQ